MYFCNKIIMHFGSLGSTTREVAQSDLSEGEDTCASAFPSSYDNWLKLNPNKYHVGPNYHRLKLNPNKYHVGPNYHRLIWAHANIFHPSSLGIGWKVFLATHSPSKIFETRLRFYHFSLQGLLYLPIPWEDRMTTNAQGGNPTQTT